MWIIKHIFDGDYGCEESNYKELMVSVTLIDGSGNEKRELVADNWLRDNNLDIGSEWPDYSDYSLETDDLILKKAKCEDCDDIYNNLWRHPESARYMLWKVTLSKEDALDRMRRTIEFQKTHKYAFFIYEKKSGKAIGFAGMKEVSPGVFEDTGIALGPDYVHEGYGTQVLDALVRAAKDDGALRFITSCRQQNIASHNLQMKCGFSFSHYENRIDPRDESTYILEFNEMVFDSKSQ